MHLNTRAGRRDRKGHELDIETNRRETNGEGMKVKERETNRHTQEEVLKEFVTLELALTECGLDNGITNHSSEVVAPYSIYYGDSILLNKKVGKEKRSGGKREGGERLHKLAVQSSQLPYSF